MSSESKVTGGESIRVWLVTDGTAEAGGWLGPLAGELRRQGAASVDVLGVPGMIGLTARGLIELGVDRIARSLRFTRAGESDLGALEAYERARPDLVVVDHPSVLRVLSVLRDATAARAVHVALLADWGRAEAWQGAGADAWVAPDPEQLAAVRSPTHSEPSLRLGGPPIALGFGRDLDAGALRAEFGIGAEERVILVDASTMIPPMLDALVFQLAALRRGFVTLFGYGRNVESAEVLRQSAAAHGLRAQMFGVVDAPEEYLAIADLVVVGAANPLLPAYLACGRPMVAIDRSLAGSAPCREGAVVSIGDAAELAPIVDLVVASGVPEGHAVAARRFARPAGTQSAAAALLAIHADRARLRAAPSAAAPSAPAAAGGDSRHSRFESIGGPTSAQAARPPAPLTKSAAKEELSRLILEEKRLEIELSELVRERDRWFGRVSLSAESGAEDLRQAAEERTQAIMRKIAEGNERRDALSRQREEIRRRVAGAASREPAASAGPDDSAAAMEARYRELEVRRDIDRLRKRIDGGGG